MYDAQTGTCLSRIEFWQVSLCSNQTLFRRDLTGTLEGCTSSTTAVLCCWLNDTSRLWVCVFQNLRYHSLINTVRVIEIESISMIAAYTVKPQSSIHHIWMKSGIVSKRIFVYVSMYPMYVVVLTTKHKIYILK